MQRAPLLERPYPVLLPALSAVLAAQPVLQPLVAIPSNRVDLWFPAKSRSYSSSFLGSNSVYLLSLFAGNAILIVADSIIGGVDHNLFPIEFLFISLLASPAYFGSVTRCRR